MRTRRHVWSDGTACRYPFPISIRPDKGVAFSKHRNRRRDLCCRLWRGLSYLSKQCCRHHYGYCQTREDGGVTAETHEERSFETNAPSQRLRGVFDLRQHFAPHARNRRWMDDIPAQQLQLNLAAAQLFQKYQTLGAFQQVVRYDARVGFQKVVFHVQCEEFS